MNSLMEVLYGKPPSGLTKNFLSVTAGIIKRLEQRKYIESFGDSEDKRIKIVRITSLGEQQCRCSDQILYQLEEDILSCLTKSEIVTLQALLNKIKNATERK